MGSNVFFRIEQITAETKDTMSYVLLPLEEDKFRYTAGQFLTFIFNFPQKSVRRSYSFSSAPTLDGFPTVTIKRVPNGEISRYIHDNWRVGDIVESLSPAGRFVLEPSEHPRDLFLLAAGSGITPIYSIVKEVLAQKAPDRIHLIYSNSNRDDAIFLKEIKNLESAHINGFEVDYFFSDSKYLDKARLSKYVLIDLIESRLRFSKDNAVFFICGPFEYMQMIGITLNSISIRPDQIRKEIFVTDDVKLPQFEMKDKTSKKVEIRLQREIHQILVPYNKSILDVALENRISLPYSCHAGKCSACVAKCTRGQVIMAYNEVLTERDESKGLILTCTGHPVTDDVVLEYEG